MDAVYFRIGCFGDSLFLWENLPFQTNSPKFILFNTFNQYFYWKKKLRD